MGTTQHGALQPWHRKLFPILMGLVATVHFPTQMPVRQFIFDSWSLYFGIHISRPISNISSPLRQHLHRFRSNRYVLSCLFAVSAPKTAPSSRYLSQVLNFYNANNMVRSAYGTSDSRCHHPCRPRHKFFLRAQEHLLHRTGKLATWNHCQYRIAYNTLDCRFHEISASQCSLHPLLWWYLERWRTYCVAYWDREEDEMEASRCFDFRTSPGID